jgi:hypothetical protein
LLEPGGAVSLDLLLLAHPLTESVVLPVPPIAVAGIAGSLVVMAASFGRVREGEALPLQRTSGAALSTVEVVARSIAVLLLLAAVVAGRVGSTTIHRNLAPVLIIAVGIPLLAVLCVALGPLWARIDPFDGLARVLRAPDDEPPPASVWPAVLIGILLVGYVFAYPPGLRPRTLGLALGGYAVLTTAGCLALGRRQWLERGEPIGLLYTWFGGLRGRRLMGWRPPGGAGALLGLVAGGSVYGLVRASDVWRTAAFRLGVGATDALGVLLLAAIGAGVVVLCERRRGDGTVVAAMVPVVAGLLVAHSLRPPDVRLLTGLQLLPGLLVDPLGQGWTIAGFGQSLPRVLPFGIATLVMVQIVVLVVAALGGARIARSRTAGRAPVAPAVIAIAVVTMAAAMAITVA